MVGLRLCKKKAAAPQCLLYLQVWQKSAYPVCKFLNYSTANSHYQTDKQKKQAILATISDLLLSFSSRLRSVSSKHDDRALLLQVFSHELVSGINNSLLENGFAVFALAQWQELLDEPPVPLCRSRRHGAVDRNHEPFARSRPFGLVLNVCLVLPTSYRKRRNMDHDLAIFAAGFFMTCPVHSSLVACGGEAAAASDAKAAFFSCLGW